MAADRDDLLSGAAENSFRQVILAHPGLQEPDKLCFSGLLVPEDQVTALFELRIDELVKRDRTVHQVGLGQGGPVLKTLEIRCGLRDQGDRDPVRQLWPDSIILSRVTAWANRHAILLSAASSELVSPPPPIVRQGRPVVKQYVSAAERDRHVVGGALPELLAIC
jgi:hypothetical protein